jgi:sugar phosphate permease
MDQKARWFPGYGVAAAATVATIASAPGQTFILSQINLPLREAFGIDELTLNSMYTVATVAAAFPLVWIGTWADRLGPRLMLVLIAFAYGFGCLVMASAQGVITVFLGFFLLRLFGQGSLSLVAQHALAMWFHRRLGALHGWKTVLTFAAWVPFPGLAVYLIHTLGWRGTYLVFAIAIPLVVAPISFWLVRNRPEDLGLQLDGDAPDDTDWKDNEEDIAPDPTAPDPESAADIPPREPGFSLKEARRTRAFWLLAAIFFLPPMIGTAFLFDIQPMLGARGMTEHDAAIVVSAWSATMAILALPAGWVTDRVHPGILLAFSLAMVALSSLVLWKAQTLVAAASSMVIFGVGQSVGASCASATVARFFGRANHGAIRSSLTRIAVIGTGLGPVIFGLSVRLSGGYTPAMIGFAAACVPILAGVLFMTQPAQEQGRNL